MVPRDKHTAGGNQARLALTRSIQGRLGSKRRMAEEGSATPDAKAHGAETGRGRMAVD